MPSPQRHHRTSCLKTDMFIDRTRKWGICSAQHPGRPSLLHSGGKFGPKHSLMRTVFGKLRLRQREGWRGKDDSPDGFSLEPSPSSPAPPLSPGLRGGFPSAHLPGPAVAPLQPSFSAHRPSLTDPGGIWVRSQSTGEAGPGLRDPEGTAWDQLHW